MSEGPSGMLARVGWRMAAVAAAIATVAAEHFGPPIALWRLDPDERGALTVFAALAVAAAAGLGWLLRWSAPVQKPREPGQ